MSFCSGIEAASAAWQPLGWQALAFSEIDPFPRAVLKQRFNAHDARCGRAAGTVPLFGDFTALRVRHFERLGIPLPDILIAGTPCQSFSQAGKRLGLNDPRGALSLHYLRIAHAIDTARKHSGLPGLVLVWENVPDVLGDRSNAFGAFLAGFFGGDQAIPYPTDPRGQPTRWADAGVASGASAICAWRLLDAQYFGVAQRGAEITSDGTCPTLTCNHEAPIAFNCKQTRIAAGKVSPPLRAMGSRDGKNSGGGSWGGSWGGCAAQ